MNLFNFIKDTYEVEVAPEALLLEPFKKLASRHKNPQMAKKELAFVYFFADIRSDYMYIVDEEERANELRKDLGLPDTWVIDPVMQKAIDFYRERSTTINSMLYQGACKAASDINEYLKITDELLNERDHNGKPVIDIAKIVSALDKIPTIMENLNKAHQKLIAEQQIIEGRSKGSKQFNMYEDGLDFE